MPVKFHENFFEKTLDNSPKFDYTKQALCETANASVAQSVEQGTENPRVGGSIPPGGTIFQMCVIRHAFEKSSLSVKESKGGS